jgi:hypothetical protein
VIVAASFDSEFVSVTEKVSAESDTELQFPYTPSIEADPNSWAPVGNPDVKCATDTELGSEWRWNTPQFLEWQASRANERKGHLTFDDSPTDFQQEAPAAKCKFALHAPVPIHAAFGKPKTVA